MKEPVGKGGRSKHSTRGFHSIFCWQSMAVQSRRGSTNVWSHTSHGRNPCTPPAQLCPPWAEHGEGQGLQSFREPQLGSHWWRTATFPRKTFLQENHSQQRFNWLPQQPCYYLCFLTWFKCPTPSLWLPRVILDPTSYSWPTDYLLSIVCCPQYYFTQW